MIQLKNIKKIYDNGDFPIIALNNINLQIKKNEFIALMGHSGSGKSTLLHLIGGIDYATSGEIWINEKNLQIMCDKELTKFRRLNIGFVFQRFNLISTLTVEENIMLPQLIKGNNIKGYKQKIEELLSYFDLKKINNKKPNQISGGQAQRVAIARALVTDPEVILLDEPTGSLDSKNSEILLELILKIQKDQKTTVIIATHNPFVAEVSGKILFLKDGIIFDSLDKNELKNFSSKVIYEKILNL